MSKKYLRRVTYTVKSQTAWHIEDLARLEGTTAGHIIDKLVREKMLSLRVERHTGEGVVNGGLPESD